MADLFGNNTTRLAVVNSRVSAGMGLGYAIASLIGGERNSHVASYCPGGLFGDVPSPGHDLVSADPIFWRRSARRA